MNLFGLQTVQFAEKDPETIRNNIIAGYEAAYKDATGTSITLYPGDPRRILLLSLAELIIQQRNIIDYTAKQNLLTYASGDFLDHIGLMVGVTRIPAQSARSTVAFTLSAEQLTNYTVPAGTRVGPGGTEIYFLTTDDLIILTGQTSGTVGVVAMASGAAANGYLPGQINKLIDPLPYIAGVSNTTTSEGGADIEDDEHLRERIQLAPEAFSVAGPYGAYEFWAKSAHQDITDVKVMGPSDADWITPGEVYVFVMLKDGTLPGQEMLDLVYETLDAEKVRPLTDHVFVQAPTSIGYTVDLTYYILKSRSAEAAGIQAAAQKAINDWIAWESASLGRDINTDKLKEELRKVGVNRTVIRSPSFAVVEKNQVAILTGTPSIEYGGLEDG